MTQDLADASSSKESLLALRMPGYRDACCSDSVWVWSVCLLPWTALHLRSSCMQQEKLRVCLESAGRSSACVCEPGCKCRWCGRAP